MHSEKEILEAFELMGLSSTEERERLENMGIFHLKTEPKESYLFIRSGNNSSTLEVENEDAKLERDSR